VNPNINILASLLRQDPKILEGMWRTAKAFKKAETVDLPDGSKDYLKAWEHFARLAKLPPPARRYRDDARYTLSTASPLLATYRSATGTVLNLPAAMMFPSVFEPDTIALSDRLARERRKKSSTPS